MADTVVQELVINTLTQAQFDAAKVAGTLSPYELYGTPDTSVRLPVLTPMWFDHIANDVSWLRADTFSWQSGDVYVAAYEHLTADFAGLTGTKYYAWVRTFDYAVYYTTAETPEINDVLYTKNTDGEFLVYDDVWEGGSESITNSSGDELVRDSSKDETALQKQTDTIGDITISYYLADDGHKICLPDQESNIVALYEKTGAADYYLLDTTNKQFKLPRKQKRTLIQAVKNDDGTWYNLYSDGYVEQGGSDSTARTINAGTGLSWYVTMPVPMSDTNYNILVSFDNGNVVPAVTNNKQTTTTQVYLGCKNQHTANVTSQVQYWQVSGYAAESAYASAGMRLEYYYVGNFEQSAIEQTAGLNAELFNSKADVSRVEVLEGYDYVIESQLPTADNGYTWYRKYKSGWVEQGGRTESGAGNKNVSLMIEMSSIAYSIMVADKSGASGGVIAYGTGSETTTGFVIYASNTTNSGAVDWQVSGMSTQ